jgi:hypothetical protein
MSEVLSSKDVSDVAYSEWLRTRGPNCHGDFSAFHAGFAAGRRVLETTTGPGKYERAVWFLQDIASLAGTTKRKQAGCEIAAHALAQLGEPRSSEKTSDRIDAEAFPEGPL